MRKEQVGGSFVAIKNARGGGRITLPCSSPPLRRKGAMQGGGSVRSKPRTHGAYAPTLEGRMPHAPYFELLSVFNSRPNPGKWKPMPLANRAPATRRTHLTACSWLSLSRVETRNQTLLLLLASLLREGTDAKEEEGESLRGPYDKPPSCLGPLLRSLASLSTRCLRSWGSQPKLPPCPTPPFLPPY